MKRTTANPGKISDSFQGLGTVTSSMVKERAREIARINGRNPGTFTQDDWAEAKRELTGTSAPDLAEEPELHAVKNWEDEPGTSGSRAPILRPSDEQTFAEELAEQGVEEAEHDQMVQASKLESKES